MYLIVHDDGSVRQVAAFDGNDREDCANHFLKILRSSEAGFEELIDARLDSESWQPVQSRAWERDDEDWEDDEESDFTEFPDDLAAEGIDDE